MEPLEWIAIAGLISQAVGGVYNAAVDQRRYNNEMEYRDDITQKKYNDLIGLGASPAYALQSVGGINNASTGTSYNEPYNLSEAFKFGGIQDLINANKTPSEIIKNNADAAKSQAEANSLPSYYEAQINEIKAKAKEADSHNKYLKMLTDITPGQVAAEIQLKNNQAITELAKYDELLQNIEHLKAVDADINSQRHFRDDIQTQIGNKEITNLQSETEMQNAQTNYYASLINQIESSIKVNDSEIQLQNTLKALNDAKTQQINQETNNLVIDALLKDIEIYAKLTGLTDNLGVHTIFGDIPLGMSEDSLNFRLDSFKALYSALQKFKEILGSVKGVDKK